MAQGRNNRIWKTVHALATAICRFGQRLAIMDRTIALIRWPAGSIEPSQAKNPTPAKMLKAMMHGAAMSHFHHASRLNKCGIFHPENTSAAAIQPVATVPQYKERSFVVSGLSFMRGGLGER